MSHRPDVLFIVMDCVRQAEFVATSGAAPSVPTFRSLESESLVFDRAISPASWTLPSHASLFTGLYPWEHGVSSTGRARLGPTVATLPEMLLNAGYRTASFSANPNISPLTGMTRGFETAHWGGFGDCSRRPVTGASSIMCSAGSNLAPSSSLERADPRGLLRSKLGSAALRVPWAYDAGLRAFSHVFPSSRTGESKVAPWIEPKLREWLSRTPKDVPAFAFINLLDAHEPYYGLPKEFPGFGEWIRLFWNSQRETALSGLGDAEARRISQTLHTLYAHAIEVMDKRIASITNQFKELRRWEDCLVVLTSDHGQAFGEEGSVYHRWGYADTLFHVPLLIRYPQGTGTSGRWSLPFSTRRVPSLILRSCGDRGDTPGRATNEITIQGGAPERTILALADPLGLSGESDDRRPGEASHPGIGIVAYIQGKKFVVPVVPTAKDLGNRIPALNRSDRGDAPHDVREDAGGHTLALEAAISMQYLREEFYDEAADRRLRGWGYS